MTTKTRRIGLQLSLAAALVGAVAFVAVATTSTPVRQPGPVIALQTSLDSACCAATRVGGIVTGYKAGTGDTLNVGDVVFFDSTTAGVVHKSATLVNYNRIAGVVVGGRTDTMNVRTDSASVGTQAALPSQKVILMRFGVTWVQIDTNAVLVNGTSLQIMPSAKNAGLAGTRTTALDTFGRIYGKVLVSSAASAKVLAQINVR